MLKDKRGRVTSSCVNRRQGRCLAKGNVDGAQKECRREILASKVDETWSPEVAKLFDELMNVECYKAGGNVLLKCSF